MADVHLLYSPRGGRGRAEAAARTVRSVIRHAGHTVRELTGASIAESLAAAKGAVADGASRLVVVGGDGIVNIGTQAVAGTETVLGVVPAGTGNDFARTFGLYGSSVTTEQAAARALGEHTTVDAITSDRGWVASTVTGGFSVDVNVQADRMRFPRGPSRYTVATLITVARLRHRRLVFTVDGESHEYLSALWAVANTPTFGGGMAICPSADPADGQLDLTVVGHVGKATLLRLLPAVFKGAHTRHRNVHTFTGSTIKIEEAPPAVTSPQDSSATSEDPEDQLRGDGELFGNLPISLSAAPRAIHLAANP